MNDEGLIKRTVSNKVISGFRILEELKPNSEDNRIYLVKREKNQELLIAEEILKSKVQNNTEFKKRIISQKKILKELTINKKNPNIVGLKPDYITKTDVTYLIFEYCNGGSLDDVLRDYVSKNGLPLKEEVVQHFMRDILNGLRDIHNHNIIHRFLNLRSIFINYPTMQDLKEKNYLNAVVKISDFSHIKVLKKEEGDFGKSFVYNSVFMSNEVRRNEDEEVNFNYDEKADIWSVGIICFKLLMAEVPRELVDEDGIDEFLEREEVEVTLSKELNISKEAISFINGMLRQDPKERLSVNDLLAHAFIVNDVKTFTPLTMKKKEEVDEKEIAEAVGKGDYWSEFKEVKSNLNCSLITSNMIIEQHRKNDKREFIEVKTEDEKDLFDILEEEKEKEKEEEEEEEGKEKEEKERKEKEEKERKEKEEKEKKEKEEEEKKEKEEKERKEKEEKEREEKERKEKEEKEREEKERKEKEEKEREEKEEREKKEKEEEERKEKEEKERKEKEEKEEKEKKEKEESERKEKEEKEKKEKEEKEKKEKEEKEEKERKKKRKEERKREKEEKKKKEEKERRKREKEEKKKKKENSSGVSVFEMSDKNKEEFLNAFAFINKWSNQTKNLIYPFVACEEEQPEPYI